MEILAGDASKYIGKRFINHDQCVYTIKKIAPASVDQIDAIFILTEETSTGFPYAIDETVVIVD